MYRIMLVDDEDNVLSALRRVLTRAEEYAGQFMVEPYNSPIKALRRALEAQFDLIISDFHMPAMDGVAFLVAVRKWQPDAARIILSGRSDRDMLLSAINHAEIARFICKPWDNDELVSTLRHVLTQRKVLLDQKRVADQARLQQG